MSTLFSQELTLYPISNLLMVDHHHHIPSSWKLLRRIKRPTQQEEEEQQDLISNQFPINFQSPYTPKMAMDMKEKETHYELIVDIPGVDKDATTIELKNHVLTISTERKSMKSSETEFIRRSERYVGSVSRSLTLPDDIDEDKIEARFEDVGLLHINIPKVISQMVIKRSVN